MDTDSNILLSKPESNCSDFIDCIAPYEDQSDPVYVFREQRSSLCPTPPQLIPAAARAVQMAAHRGWWQCSDLATHSA